MFQNYSSVTCQVVYFSHIVKYVDSNFITVNTQHNEHIRMYSDVTVVAAINKREKWEK